MRFKRLLALLLAAALALAVLVGCGSGQQSAAQALLKLLDGKYPNISIEIDPDLEADLRQAISQAEAENAGDDAAAIRAALEKLVGSTVTFRYLGEGQQGDTTFDLVFYAGTDPDKAAQAAYSQWNIVFANVPDDGKYGTGLAMVETENGIWMLVKATVEQAGTVDKPDKDDDEPDEPEANIVKGTGFSYDVDHNQVTVSGEKGLEELFTDTTNTNSDLVKARDSGFDNVVITLDAGTEYTVTEQLAADFKGTLKGENESSKAKITLSGTSGLFGTIVDGGEVSNLDITVSGTISGNGNIGAVAGTNYGTIENCDVTGGTIESTDKGDVGGIVGANGAVSTSGITSGSIIGCSAEVTVKNDNYAGGVVGKNYSGSITACFSTGAVTGSSHAGGVVGVNYGTVTACYHADGVVSGSFAGGVAGSAYSNSVTDCYWSGSPNAGIGGGKQSTDDAYSKDEHQNMVTGDWTEAVKAMNDAILAWNRENTDNSCNYHYDKLRLNLPRVHLYLLLPRKP